MKPDRFWIWLDDDTGTNASSRVKVCVVWPGTRITW